MSQNGMVDVRARIAEYERLLENYASEVVAAQTQIKNYQALIADCENKAVEVRNIIAVCKRLLGGDEISSDTIMVKHPESIRKKQNLPDAIVALLDALPDQDFSVSWITEKLNEQGYPTKAKDFKSVIRSTTARMAAENTIRVREEGQNKIYWSRLREQEGGLLDRSGKE